MKQDLSEEQFLQNYNPDKYPKPAVSVDILIFSIIKSDTGNRNNVKVLLIKRKGHPYRDCWAIPGGFINLDEDIEAAAYRELKEETNVDNVTLEQLYTFGSVNRDPRMRVISIAYLAICSDAHIAIQAGDDAKEAKWFNIEYDDHNITLKNDDCRISYKKIDEVWISDYYTDSLAFDHIDILERGLNRFAHKVKHHAL